MTLKGDLGSLSYTREPIYSNVHPPIILTMEALADNGTLPRGLWVAKDSNGKIVAYDPAGADPVNAPVGILVEDVDTTENTAAQVLVHGIVVASKTFINPTAKNTPADTDWAKFNYRIVGS